MTDIEVLLRLSGSEVRLAFDTSAVFADAPFLTVCALVARLNALRSEENPIRLAICAAAHAEKLFDLKQEKKELFNEAAVMKILERKGVSVLPFDRQHARRLAELLGERYPDTKAWRAAKRQRYIETLGIQNMQEQIPGSGRACSATVDWLIAAHAIEESCLLVTEDGGPEFRGVIERVKMASLKKALEELLIREQERASAS